MPIRAESTQGCSSMTHLMMVLMSSSSLTPSCLYAGQEERAPWPLAVQGSARKQTMPRWAMVWSNERPPPHEPFMVGVCGPAYVMNQTGYFFDGSKSGG